MLTAKITLQQKRQAKEVQTPFIKCQDAKGEFFPNATNCEDDAGLAICSESFPPNRGISANATRPTLCESPELFEEAIQCAKTCKLCCEVASKKAVNTGATGIVRAGTRLVGDHLTVTGPGNGSCQDDPVFILECSYLKAHCEEDNWTESLKSKCTATCGECSPFLPEVCLDKHLRCGDIHNASKLCEDPQYGPLFQQRCAVSCHKCDPKENANSTKTATSDKLRKVPETLPHCVDRSDDCQRNAFQCNNTLYRTLMREQCPRTCNVCSTPITAHRHFESTEHKDTITQLTTSKSDCSDTHENCPAWNANGFCDSIFYPQSTKVELCAKTCSQCE
ncbi:shK domain-like domain-containing protein [Ditylenchus destructor]|nr:shK domain-like domain-containing protein [Ditylenchus destructor]